MIHISCCCSCISVVGCVISLWCGIIITEIICLITTIRQLIENHLRGLNHIDCCRMIFVNKWIYRRIEDFLYPFLLPLRSHIRILLSNEWHLSHHSTDYFLFRLLRTVVYKAKGHYCFCWSVCPTNKRTYSCRGWRWALSVYSDVSLSPACLVYLLFLLFCRCFV